jgi:hypothetical protein
MGFNSAFKGLISAPDGGDMRLNWSFNKYKSLDWIQVTRVWEAVLGSCEQNSEYFGYTEHGESLIKRVNIRLPGRTLLHGAMRLLT